MEMQSIKPAVLPSISFNGADLLQAAKACNLAVERRNSIPILSNIRLLGNGSSIYLTGTDLDMEISVSIPGQADSRFGITVTGTKLADVGKAAGKADVAMQFVPGTDSPFVRADITGKAAFNLQAISVADFPIMGIDKTGAHSFAISGHELRGLFEAVAFAVSLEETRYYLNGVYLHSVDVPGQATELRAVATDGHRLGHAAVPCPAGAGGMPGVIVPRKTVGALLRLWKGKACPENVMVTITESKVRFTWARHCLTSKVIDGTFPDYSRVIPTSFATTLSGNGRALLDTVKAVSFMGTTKDASVKITLEDGSTAAKLETNNPDCGSARDAVTVDVSGPGLEIGFNGRYLQDIIAAACPDGGTFRLELNSAGDPAKCWGTREGVFYILMPKRV